MSEGGSEEEETIGEDEEEREEEMTVNVTDHNSLIEISLYPETIAEAALLLRLARNAKRSPQSIRTYFSGNTIDTNIQITMKHSGSICVGNDLKDQ